MGKAFSVCRAFFLSVVCIAAVCAFVAVAYAPSSLSLPRARTLTMILIIALSSAVLEAARRSCRRLRLSSSMTLMTVDTHDAFQRYSMRTHSSVRVFQQSPRLC